MGVPRRRVVRRVVTVALIGIAVLGLASFGLGFLGLLSSEDPELLRSTREAEPLIRRIAEFKKLHGHYPVHLSEVRSTTAPAGLGGSMLIDGDEACAEWCWLYLSRGAVAPPILFRRLNWHGNLVYEFPPVEGAFYLPTGVDEGWVVRREGSVRFLRSREAGASGSAPAPATGP